MRKQLISIMMAAFSLWAIPAFAQQATPINFDQPVSGEITEENNEVLYSFEGTAGDTISVTMSATDDQLDSYLILLNPGGDTLFIDDDGAGNRNAIIGPYTLQDNGTYTVIATRCCGRGVTMGTTGGFTLTLARKDLIRVTVGQPMSITLSDEQPMQFLIPANPTGDEAMYALIARRVEGASNFAALTRNNMGMIQMQEVSYETERIQLEPIGFDVDQPMPVMIQLWSDEYGLTSTGSATLEVTLAAIEAETVAGDSTISGTLNAENPTDYYRFTVGPTDIFSLDGTQLSDHAYDVQVFSPSGINIMYSSTEYSREFILNPIPLYEPGEYLIIVRRSYGPEGKPTNQISQYEMTLNYADIQVMSAGVQVTGTVGGEENFDDLYRFDGKAGQTVRITLQSMSDTYGPGLDMQQRQGLNINSMIMNLSGPLKASASYEVTLPYDDIYLIRVWNSYQQPTPGVNIPPIGDYALQIDVVN